MTATRSERPQAAPAGRSGSVHLGTRLRSILISPKSGFRGAMRAGVAERASASPLPAFLVFLGGAASLLVYLKLSGLMGLRELAVDDFKWSAFFPLLLLGALAGVGAYFLWARLGPSVARNLGGKTSAERLRLAWSFADFPLATYLALILPLDLLLVGPEVFATEELDGTVAMVWGAVSVALALSAALWSAFLLWRGIEAATGVRGGKTFVMLVVGFGCYVAVAALLIILIRLLEVLFT